MGGTPDQPDSGPSWRGQPVNPRIERRAASAPPPAPPGIGDEPPTYRGPGSGRAGPRWGAILAVIFGLIAGLMFLWILGLSADLEEEEATRINAEREAATAATQRNEAIAAANTAVDRANQEIDLRATAEADAGAAELLAQQETRMRATAEAQVRRAEDSQERAEANAERESSIRATAEATLKETEEQAELGLTVAETLLAWTVAETSPTILAIAAQEVNFYIDPIPWYASDGVTDAVQDIVEVLEEWTPYGAQIRQTQDELEADIHVQWVRDYGDHILGLAVHQTVIHVGLGSTNCHDEWQSFDSDTVEKILWHEFGHAFGYGHSEDLGNIMYPTLKTRFAVEQDFSEVISPLWYWTVPFCEAGFYSFEFETEDTRNDFQFAVLPLLVSFEDYLDDSRSAYQSCEFGEWQRISEACRVDIGSRAMIYNNDPDEAIEVHGQIVFEDRPPWPNKQWDQDAFYYDEETLDYYRELFAE